MGFLSLIGLGSSLFNLATQASGGNNSPGGVTPQQAALMAYTGEQASIGARGEGMGMTPDATARTYKAGTGLLKGALSGIQSSQANIAGAGDQTAANNFGQGANAALTQQQQSGTFSNQQSGGFNSPSNSTGGIGGDVTGGDTSLTA
jgi:hypothetical protein